MKLFLKILFFIFTIITAVVGESKSSTAVNLLQKEISDSIYQKHQYTTFVFENHSINFCVNEESVVNYSEQGVTVAVNAAKGGLPAKVFSTKAPTQVTPGITKLAGQHIDDLGRVQPWKASYDNFGRLIERTDWNAANSVYNIEATHYHIWQYLPKGQVNSINHIPGVGPLSWW